MNDWGSGGCGNGRNFIGQCQGWAWDERKGQIKNISGFWQEPLISLDCPTPVLISDLILPAIL
jgi:hypothetical protein